MMKNKSRFGIMKYGLSCAYPIKCKLNSMFILVSIYNLQIADKHSAF